MNGQFICCSHRGEYKGVGRASLKRVQDELQRRLPADDPTLPKHAPRQPKQQQKKRQASDADPSKHMHQQEEVKNCTALDSPSRGSAS